MIRKTALLVLTVLTSIAFSGCDSNLIPSMEEIDQFQIVEVVGIDKCAEDPSKVEVTFISKLEKSTSGNSGWGGGGGSTIVTISSSKGADVFDAEREIKAHSDNKTFLGHVDYFLIGEDAAKEDFTKYFDFINRDHETRLSPKVYITKGCSAKEFIFTTSTGDKFIADRLKNIPSDIDLLSNIDQVKILDVSAMLNNPNEATIIPALRIKEIKDEKLTGGDMPERDICESGYAVIKNFKLAGYISDTYSRGYNFLVNKVESCPVSVKDSTGLYVGLEVIDANTKMEAEFNGDTLEKVIYTTHVTCNLQEQQSREKITDQSTIENLCTNASEIIKAEMEKVIGLSKEYKTDCTRLSEKIEMQHPLKWKKIKDRWNEIYPDLIIEVVVKTDMARTYDIREPNGYQMES